MDNLRRKSSKRYKKRTGNQYTTSKAVESVIKHMLDEIEAAEENKITSTIINNQVDSLAKEAEYNTDMTVNSTSTGLNASYSKLKDFPVVSDEFTITPSPCRGDKKHCRRQV